MIATFTKHLRFARALKSRPYARVWIGRSLSGLGDGIFYIALAWQVLLMTHYVYGQGAWLLGLISSTVAVGSLLGLLLVGQTKRLKRRGLISYLSLIPAGAGIVLFGLPWSHPAFFVVGPVASAMFGFSGAFFNTNWFTILQETIPGEKLGRVISLTMLGSFASIPIAQALGGALTDRLGPAVVFLLGGLLALSTNFLPLLVRDVREMK